MAIAKRKGPGPVGMRYDWHSREGRAELDADVRKALKKESQSRGDVADALGVDREDDAALRAVAASLARGCRDGWAEPTDQGPRTRYKRAAKEGGGK